MSWEDKKTPDKCIQDRVFDIKTDTEDTPISFQTEKIIRLSRQVFLTDLEELLDPQGNIPTSNVVYSE
jgi:hypothetical protein